MSLAFRLSLTDQVSPTGRALAGALVPAQLFPVIGRSAVGTFRKHLFEVNRTRPNALGGTRTGFYASAARGTSFETTGDGVTLTVASVGIRQRVLGGTIRPKTAKFLTIPVAPEAHGKRAREFGNLVVVFGPGGRPIALATPAVNIIQYRKKRKSQERIGKSLGRRAGTILFRLVKSVTQRPDPTVIPSQAAVQAGVTKDAGAYLDRLIARRGAK